MGRIKEANLSEIGFEERSIDMTVCVSSMSLQNDFAHVSVMSLLRREMV
jgi:hypothetical protein